MAEYIYKGFKIFYEVNPCKNTKNLFGSYGYVINPNSSDEDVLAKFHTDCINEKDGPIEIRKLIERYVDFEWHQYDAMAK